MRELQLQLQEVERVLVLQWSRLFIGSVVLIGLGAEF